LSTLGEIAFAGGELGMAERWWGESLAMFRADRNWRALALELANLARAVVYQGGADRAEVLLAESLELAREVGDPSVVAFARLVTAEIAAARGDAHDALSQYREALAVFRELEEQPQMERVLRGMACLAATSGQGCRALRLAGAAAGLRDAIKLVPSPAELVVLERHLELARLALTDSEAGRALADGMAMSLDQAVELALAD